MGFVKANAKFSSLIYEIIIKSFKIEVKKAIFMTRHIIVRIMRIKKMNIEKILFLDIETVPEVYNFNDLDNKTAELYDKKTKFFQKDGLTAEDVYDRAGIYAEFGKIVCISCGIVSEKSTGKEIRMKSFSNHDERKLLLDFSELLNDYYNTPNHSLCGHNAKEFDFPFIARRMLINGIDIPDILDIAGKKTLGNQLA